MNFFRKRFNMRRRLVVAFVLVSLVPLFLHTAFNTRNAREILVEDANQSLLTAASETANSLDMFIKNNLEAIRAEAQFPVLVQFLTLPSDLREDSDQELTILAFLSTLSKKDPHITSYALLNASGVAILDTVADGIGKDEATSNYFTFFLNSSNLRTYVSPVQFSPTTGKPSLYFSGAVVDRNGQFLGVLRARYDASVLQDLIQEKNGIVGIGSFAALFDEHHLFLANGQDASVNFLPITRLPEDKLTQLRAENRLPNLDEEQLFTLDLADLDANLSEMRKQPFFEAAESATDASINQVAVVEMNSRPWAVAFFQPQDVFLASIETQRRTTLLLAGLLGVVSMMMAFGIGNFIGKPIIYLARVVTSFTQGNLGVRANIDSQDEIGVLAKSFNKMAEQVSMLVHGLEERTRDLEKEVATRQQAEDSLRESEMRYRTTADLTTDYIYSLKVMPDGEFIIDWMTGAFQLLTGYTPEEMEARGGWRSIILPDDFEFYAAKRQELLTTGKRDVIEYRIITKDGSVKWIRDHRRPTWDESQGRVVNVMGAAYDYTVRKETQLELGRLAAIVENSNDAILSANPEGVVVSWNPAAEKMLGYRAEEAVGRALPDLIAPEGHHKEAYEMFMRLARGEHFNQTETLRIGKSGKKIDVSATFSPIRDAQGNVSAISAIIRDITEQKKAERDLQQAKDAAEAANRAKSAFLANMSHELRTPLNAILGFTQLMARDQSLASDQQENLQIISRSGEHLLALINDILELSKIEAGRTALRETTFDLHGLLGDLEDMFHLRALDKGLHIILDQEENLPQYVRADEGKLRQVMINLIGNAIKFTKEGGVSIRAGSLPGPDGVRLQIEVEDTGPGIDPAEHASLFEAFVQTQTGTEVKEGTGLGLSISQQFVQMMGGEIRVISELGKGAIFRFDIPVQPANASEIIIDKPTRKVTGIQPGQPTYRLLVVEDRLENRKLLVRLLRPFGFEIREASDGREGIEVWDAWNPHLIWMDMRMPVMGGYEATQHIKATTKGQSTVIIAITASAFEEDRAMILSAGCDDFVSKPFREAEIFEMLSKHLGVRFLYEDLQPGREAAEAETAARFSSDGLSKIPLELRTKLHQATIQADLDRVVMLIEQIEEYDVHAARVLSEFAQNFDYAQIIKLTE